MKISLRKPVEVPACISSFIGSVVASNSLADALDGFVWAYDKVIISHGHIERSNFL